jgi:hypothetical protein
MKKDEIDYVKVLMSTVDDIAAEVDAFAREQREEIEERYTTNNLTEALEKLYDQPLTASDPVDVALTLKILIADVKSQRRMPLALLMYNIGVLWCYLALNTGRADVPRVLKAQHRSELGAADQRKGWESIVQEREEMLRCFASEAEERYAKGSRLWHHDMVHHLLRQEEFADIKAATQASGRDRLALRKLLHIVGQIAEPYGRKRGTEKKINLSPFSSFYLTN